jgi:Mn-dependent DtxR family transcriptional regulator
MRSIKPLGAGTPQGAYLNRDPQMNNNKSKQPTLLHFRLTNQDWVSCFTKLNRAELGVLFYIRTLDPWGDRPINVNSTVIAEILGIHRSSVSRALKKLDREGFISLEVVTAKATSKTQNLANLSVCMDAQAVHERTSCASAHSDVHGHTDDVHSCAAIVHGRTDQSLESSQNRASGSPQTYTNFIHTLSDTVREKFFNFVREKVKDFNPPINDKEAWLAGSNGAGKERFRVYYAMFQAEVGEAVAPSQDWESHPSWQEALAAMRTGVPRFIVLGQPGCEDIDKPTRQAMFDYAQAHNLIWGEK